MSIAAAYNRCVYCGLCLPHCPTFQLSGYEAESPRGRIILVKGLVEAQLAASPTLAHHLETCLHCGQCEAVCPARVPVEKLMNTAKSLLTETQPALLHPVPRWLRCLSTSTLLQRMLCWLVRLLQTSGVLKALFFLRRLIRLRWLMPLAALARSSFTAPKASVPAMKKPLARPRVALFVGCVAAAFDNNTLRAARYMLQSVGYAVELPGAQTCCAALYEHGGDSLTTQQLILKNRQAFSAFDEVVSCASGCAATLQRHHKELGFKSRDIHSFLLEHASTLQFRPLAKRVYLHTPCSLRAHSQATAVSDLLSYVPALTVTHLSTTACCGAAGMNMLQHPATAAALAKPIIDELAAAAADLLLTANMGCALHLRQQLFCRGLHTELMHPVELLAKQLQC